MLLYVGKSGMPFINCSAVMCTDVHGGHDRGIGEELAAPGVAEPVSE